MKFTTDISVSEFKALLELISELCRRAGLDECVTRAMFKRLNEKSFR